MKKEFINSARKITSGNMVQVLADPVQKFIMIEAKSTVAVKTAVKWAVIATDTWKYGIMYLHSLIMTVRVTIVNWSKRI